MQHFRQFIQTLCNHISYLTSLLAHITWVKQEIQKPQISPAKTVASFFTGKIDPHTQILPLAPLPQNSVIAIFRYYIVQIYFLTLQTPVKTIFNPPLGET